MWFACSGKELKKFQIEYLILKGFGLKSFKVWSTNVTHKAIHKQHSKSDPQLLFKNWPITVTQKVIHKRYSKNGPQLLLKKWSKNVTQKVIHKLYSKNGLETLLIFLTLENMTIHLKFKRTQHLRIKKTSHTNVF